MKFLVILISTFSIAHADWIDLFDGKTTKGWFPRQKVITFEAKNGELHLLAETNVWVTTEVKLADFEAELEVFLPDEPHFNSGFSFRCQSEKAKPVGYQIEIDRIRPGALYGIGLGGWLSKEKGILNENDWNHFRVVAVGDSIQTWVNGKSVSKIHDKKQLEGYFGIQHHGKGGTVRFRKLRLRPLIKKKS